MAVEILVARECSFCPGVERALRITNEVLEVEGGRVYSVGPLIHNPEVVSRLGEQGLAVLGEDLGPDTDLEGAVVVIRSHGIDTETAEKLAGRGARLVDATCPIVKGAQEAAREMADAGRTVVVVGSRLHPEVRSIVGRCPSETAVLESAGEARSWVEREGKGVRRIGVVCQTTIPRDLLDSVLGVIGHLGADVEVRDTLCKAVSRRQAEALDLAGRVDLMLVVGGKNSSNTAHLAAMCSRMGTHAHHIEGPREIDPGWLENVRKVGVTGGASTPGWLIKETVLKLGEMSGE